LATAGSDPGTSSRRSSGYSVLGYDPCKLWISGFRRKVVEAVQKRMGEQILSFLPAACCDGSSLSTRRLSSAFSISFRSAAAAADALNIIKGKSLKWADPKSKELLHMRVKRDRSQQSRRQARVLGLLWTSVEAKLRELGKWAPDYVMQSSGPGGVLFIESAEDAIELFVVRANNDSYEIECLSEGIAAVGLDEGAAKQLGHAVIRDLLRPRA